MALFSPWNTGLYPLNKSDIFTGCYFHTVKMSKVSSSPCKINNECAWCHIIYCMQRPSFEKKNVKSQWKCNKQKIQRFFPLNIEFLSRVRQIYDKPDDKHLYSLTTQGNTAVFFNGTCLPLDKTPRSWGTVYIPTVVGFILHRFYKAITMNNF